MIHALHWNVLHLLSSHVQWSHFALAKASVCCSSLHCTWHRSRSHQGLTAVPHRSAQPDHELCPRTLAWLTAVHSSGWCMRSSNKSHDQQHKQKNLHGFNFAKIAVEFIQGEGKCRVDTVWQPASDGEACVGASSKSGISCDWQWQRIYTQEENQYKSIHNASALHGELHTEPERNDLYFRATFAHDSLVSYLELHYTASAHTDNPNKLQYQQWASSYMRVGFIRKNEEGDCVFMENYFNKALNSSSNL